MYNIREKGASDDIVVESADNNEAKYYARRTGGNLNACNRCIMINTSLLL